MNFRKIIVCLAGGLTFCAGLRAQDLALNDAAVLPNNPYATIVTRNVFNLNPPVVDTNPPVDTSIPKITPNGIMSVFGKLQVLFKATPTGKSGQKDEYYTLSEGTAQDDIEVMHIDDKDGIITFKNHGTVQEIPLVVAPSTGGASSSPSPLPGNSPVFNQPGDNQGGGGPGNRITRFGNRGGGPGGFNRRGGNNQDNGATGGNGDDSTSLRTIPTRVYQPEAPTMSPEESAIRIEQQRAELLDSPNPKYPPTLLPPTPLTGQY